jgi:hypothetical protein
MRNDNFINEIHPGVLQIVLFVITIAITVGLTSDDWNTCRVIDSERQATAGF